MFNDIIKSLNVELDGLRSKRAKCEELRGKVQDREKKAKLSTQYDIICHAIDRAALCIDILDYRVSVEISEDFSTVRFPIPQPRDNFLKEADNGKVQSMRLFQ